MHTHMNQTNGRTSLSTDKIRCNRHCAYTRTHTPRLMVWKQWVPYRRTTPSYHTRILSTHILWNVTHSNETAFFCNYICARCMPSVPRQTDEQYFILYPELSELCAHIFRKCVFFNQFLSLNSTVCQFFRRDSYQFQFCFVFKGTGERQLGCVNEK